MTLAVRYRLRLAGALILSLAAGMILALSVQIVLFDFDTSPFDTNGNIWNLVGIAIVAGVMLRLNGFLRPATAFLREHASSPPPGDDEALRARETLLRYPFETAKALTVGWAVLLAIQTILDAARAPLTAGEIFLLIPTNGIAALASIVLGFYTAKLLTPRLLARTLRPELPPIMEDVIIGFRTKFAVSMICGALIALLPFFVIGYGDTIERSLITYVRLPESTLEEIMRETDTPDAAMERIRAEDQKRRQADHISYLMLLALFAGLIGAGAWFISLDMHRPIARFVEYTRGLAEQDYSRDVDVLAEDEIGILASVFQTMVENIRSETANSRQLLGTIAETSRVLADTSARLLAVAEEQSTLATEEATSVQEAATTAEEIAATARAIAGHADNVNAVASQTVDACTTGNTHAGQSVERFTQLADHVEEISSGLLMLTGNVNQIRGIVQLIEEIASQVDLLALNAALEAVGAGEAGERFGVVAQEVGRLAQSTNEATTEISRLVATITDAMSSVGELANQGGVVLEENMASTDDITEALSNISTAATATQEAAQTIANATTQQTTASNELATALAQVQQAADRLASSSNEVQMNLNELATLARDLAALSSDTNPAGGGAHPIR